MAERYWEILKINWKHNLRWHILIAFVICASASCFMSVENLDSQMTARVMESYITLIGVIVCVPLFMPDQDKKIEALLTSKKEPRIKLYLIRVLQAVFCLAILLGVFLLYLRYGRCQFDFGIYFYAAMANALFLGGLGVLGYGLSNQVMVGYALPVLYYILCYGAGQKYLGNFYLFTLMQGSSHVSKHYLLAVGICMLTAAIVYKSRRTKVKHLISISHEH